MTKNLNKALIYSMFFFLQVQDAVFTKLQVDERFLESFKRSVGYVKLLAELDLLKDPSKAALEDEADDMESQSLVGDEEINIYDSLSVNSYEDELQRNYGGEWSPVARELTRLP